MTIEKEIEADVTVLMYRSFFEKEIHVFGEDGFGKYGRNERAKTFKICDIKVDVELDPNTNDVIGIIYLMLSGYDSDDCGLIFSDQNAEISLRKLLMDEHIDQSCIKWANHSLQGRDYIVMLIDVSLLLDWA